MQGTLVSPRGTEGFGFDPVFLPDDSDLTLSQAKPDSLNARAKAIEALVAGKVFSTQETITDWKGKWQHD